jgi:diacylglycerol kinase
MEPGKEAPRGAAGFWRSVGYAWNGLLEASAQRNMRIHLVAGILAGAFAALAPLDGVERALIALCTALVIAAESANTALEALVDLHGGPPSEPARISKDAAAGAVLALAAGSVAVFLLLVAGRWDELCGSWRELWAPGAAGLGLAAVAALLLGRRRPGPAWIRALGAAGTALLALLAATSRCPLCAALPGGLFWVTVCAVRHALRGAPGPGVTSTTS